MKNNQSMENSYALDLVVLPNDKMDQFNEFVQQYGNMSDKQIYREIARVKNEVSQDVLGQHIRNLDSLSKLEGFVTDDHRQRINMVKNILTAQTRAPRPSQQLAVDAQQFFGGTSLLLWFLILASIWRRRPFFWGGF